MKLPKFKKLHLHLDHLNFAELSVPFVLFVLVITLLFMLLGICTCATDKKTDQQFLLHHQRWIPNRQEAAFQGRAILLQEIPEKKEPTEKIGSTTEMIVKLGMDILAWFRDPKSLYPIFYGIALTALTLAIEYFIQKLNRKPPLPPVEEYWSEEEEEDMADKMMSAFKKEDDGSLNLASSVVSLITHGFGLGAAKTSLIDEVNQFRNGVIPYLVSLGVLPPQSPPPGGGGGGSLATVAALAQLFNRQPSNGNPLTAIPITTPMAPATKVSTATTTQKPKPVVVVPTADIKKVVPGKAPRSGDQVSSSASISLPITKNSTCNPCDAVAAFVPKNSQGQIKY